MRETSHRAAARKLQQDDWQKAVVYNVRHTVRRVSTIFCAAAAAASRSSAVGTSPNRSAAFMETPATYGRELFNSEEAKALFRVGVALRVERSASTVVGVGYDRGVLASVAVLPRTF